MGKEVRRVKPLLVIPWAIAHKFFDEFAIQPSWNSVSAFPRRQCTFVNTEGLGHRFLGDTLGYPIARQFAGERVDFGKRVIAEELDDRGNDMQRRVAVLPLPISDGANGDTDLFGGLLLGEAEVDSTLPDVIP